jgi:tRNA U34 5-carboxymethylaminomethyl modifying GTPase MnmE/TrmE
MLVDTPGRRETEDDIERAAITRSDNVIRSADLVIVVRQPFERNDAFDVTWPRSILVMNKLDKLREAGMGMGLIACFTIATTGEGVDRVRQTIRQALGCSDLTPDRPRCWTDRQRAALQHHPRDVLVGHE